ncbi:RNA-directed DNA polymerase, eukaryota, reverse transcriptase zinc-binding domain protein [Tanacetum coccineum]|uniref:RNA-directed DNA polymerase, eukaryota, reverse transcriptase zinc-binding domain protein n=1 Tax=Tanacetum coccineum TaxID=301880 RepID=A0ABQ4YF13_9ASTR
MDSGLKMSKLKVDVWNVRGLNQEKRQKEVTQLIKEEKLNVCVIVESYLKANKLAKACSKTFGSWSDQKQSANRKVQHHYCIAWHEC